MDARGTDKRPGGTSREGQQVVFVTLKVRKVLFSLKYRIIS